MFAKSSTADFEQFCNCTEAIKNNFFRLANKLNSFIILQEFLIGLYNIYNYTKYITSETSLSLTGLESIIREIRKMSRKKLKLVRKITEKQFLTREIYDLW